MGWWNRFQRQSSTGVAKSARRQSLQRMLRAECLEPRHLMAVTVFLDFGDASGSNSFAARLQEVDPLTFSNSSNVSLLKTNIAAAVQSAFAGYDVTITQTQPVGEYETLSYGRTKDFVIAAPERFGQADLDWLNINHTTNPGEATAYVFPAEFTKADLANPASNLYLNRMGNALAFWGVHELGHAFGLENQDAFGDVSIIPDVYTNTLGVQNRNFMAIPSFGLSAEQFDSLAGFAFSPLSRVKLGFASRLTAAPFSTTPESAAAHSSIATAQPLTFTTLPSAGGQVVNVELASASSEKDYYKFDVQAGELLTVTTLATNVYEHTLDPTQTFSFDTIVRLFKPDGTTVVMTSDDIQAGINKFGGTSGTTLVDQDSLIVNYRIPDGAGGTYYVEVASKTQTPGFYDLLVAKWTPTLHPWQRPTGDARDVTNGDGIVARDALLVINEINRAGNGGRRLPNPLVGAENPVVPDSQGGFNYFYFDVNGDNFVTAVDALLIINYLNNPTPQGGEGEADSLPAVDHPSSATVDESFALAGAWWAMDDVLAGLPGKKK